MKNNFSKTLLYVKKNHESWFCNIWVYIIILFILLVVNLFIETSCRGEVVPDKKKVCEEINVELIRSRLSLAEGVVEKYYMALIENDVDKSWSCMDDTFYKVTPKEKWLRMRKIYKGENLSSYSVSEKYCIFIEGSYIAVQFICHAIYPSFISVEYVSINITDEDIGIGSIKIVGFKEFGSEEKKEEKKMI